MENRPTALRSRRVCRFCLTENEPLNFIYERDHSKPFHVPLPLKIMSCVSIEVYSADGMPQIICNTCKKFLDLSYRFKKQCKKADEALRSYPISGVLPRPFPPIITEVPDRKRQLDHSTSAIEMKKSRVDNGDRDQKRQESIKAEMYKEEHHQDSVGDEDMEMMMEDKEPGEVQVYACNQCNRTFSLRQSLQLHIQQAHRDRNSKCNICDRMFFNKYDLQKHMATHSEDKPYSCSICNKSFTRANLLQRHEKIHREDLRFSCQHCDREFFTQEDLEKHEDTSHKSAKPYQCNICSKRFTYKQGLERHEMLHADDKSFVCEYCKEAFHTSTKLARHLQTHAGHRPYPCKLCPRNFLLSHHLTRHMRTHSVEKNHVCDECGKAFKRKESLEVHQLTHSKRGGSSLTCEVCHETCRNRADYVTHIRQHIEAGEKMGPDGLAPNFKEKIEVESEEEEEEEEDGEQYSDNDDDYQPPAYVARKYTGGKSKRATESEEDINAGGEDEKEERKEQVVYIRGKDGQLVKKTIKTMTPISQQRSSSNTSTTNAVTTTTSSSSKPTIISQKKIEDGGKRDDTDAEVQKIVASVFQEHKISLKNTKISQEVREPSRAVVKEDKIEPKSTVKVIKRIVVKKSGGSGGGVAAVAAATATATTTAGGAADGGAVAKESETKNKVGTTGATTKVTKRVIVRRIIRQGDTTREVIMNPDGTLIDPSELAKLPTGNVVKRVVVKKPIEKVVPPTEQPAEPLKFELKTSQSTPAPPVVEANKQSENVDTNSKETVEFLQKKVEQQRLKIAELEARKHEYESMDDMLPERRDSEDEQELPLKRVFVKRKQSIYDEEQEYHDPEVPKSNDKSDVETEKITKNGKTVSVKSEAVSNFEQIDKEINNMLDSKATAIKRLENVLTKPVEQSKSPVQQVETVQEQSDFQEAIDEVSKDTNQTELIKIEKFSQETITASQPDAMEIDQEVPNSSEQSDIFDTSIQVKPNDSLEMSLSQSTETGNLNDTNDSQDSLEDKLSQMEG